MSFRTTAVLLSVFVYGYFYPATLQAESREFDFKDPKGVNAVSFVLDSVLEPIMGLASGVSGEVQFDPDDLKKTTGRIVIETKTIHIENQRMKNVLHSSDWLDVEQYPKIEFVFKSTENVKTRDKLGWKMMVQGDFTCKGVTKQITVPMKATYLPGRAGERLRGKKGDLLVLRSNFTIKRSHFGIKPGIGELTVAEDIEVRVSIVGSAITE